MFYRSVTLLNINSIICIDILFISDAGRSQVFLPYVAKGVWGLTLLYGISLHEALMMFLFYAVSDLLGQEKIREDLSGQEHHISLRNQPEFLKGFTNLLKVHLGVMLGFIYFFFLK